MQLSEALEEFLKEDRARSTNETYRGVLGKLFAALGPHREVDAISSNELRDYLVQMQEPCEKFRGHPRHPVEVAPYSPATRKKFLRTIRAFFNWCVSAGYLEKAPKVSLRRLPDVMAVDKAIPPSELSAIVASLRERKRRHWKRDLAILLFIADTGCRVGGCASLTLDNLNLLDYSALLIEKGSKPHRAFFGDETKEALRDWLLDRPDVSHRYVFVAQGNHRRFSTGGIRTMIRRLGRDVVGHPMGPHAIRHRVGQALADAGVNPEVIRQKLGHSDVAITLKYYCHQDQSRVRLVSRRLALVALRETL